MPLSLAKMILQVQVVNYRRIVTVPGLLCGISGMALADALGLEEMCCGSYETERKKSPVHN